MTVAIRKGWRSEVIRTLETFRGLDLADEGRSSRPIFAKMTICVKSAWRDHHEWFVELLSLSPERLDNLVTGGCRFLESFPEGRHVSFPGFAFASESDTLFHRYLKWTPCVRQRRIALSSEGRFGIEFGIFI